uniref:Uncharacterized protein n=1 Tax=Magallana gigas TaxID=29159 RepID=K1QXS8_MAGGI
MDPWAYITIVPVTIKLGDRCKPVDSEDVISRKLTALNDTLEYHESCIREWFERSGNFRCPGCRQECLDQTKRTPDKNISEREPIISDDIISRKLKTLHDKLGKDTI